MSEPDPQTVYVLDADCYSDRYIVGVYATPEAAMLAWQPSGTEASRARHPYTWSEEMPGERWSFAADWHDYAEVVAFPLISLRASPLPFGECAT